MYFVYKVTNQINGKIYIGWTSKSVGVRWSAHLDQVNAPSGKKYFFQNAIKKYGSDSFELETLISSYDKSFSLQMETYYIQRYQSHNPSFGYNLTMGGEGNIPILESRLKMSNATKGERHHAFGKRGAEMPWYGRKHKEESIQKMSETTRKMVMGKDNPFYGRKHSEESIEKIKDSLRKLETSGENNPFYGKNHSEETKRKMKAVWAERRSKLLINQPEVIQLIQSFREEGVTWDKMGARLNEHGIVNPQTGKPYSPMGCSQAFKNYQNRI